MNKTKQRIKIAEACGWEPCGWRHLALGGVEDWWRNAEENAVARLKELPDYLNDLNAMHEAEKMLTYKQGSEMTVWIKWMTCHGYGPQLFATAEQRAEAFLRTLGLWEDSE